MLTDEEIENLLQTVEIISKAVCMDMFTEQDTDEEFLKSELMDIAFRSHDFYNISKEYLKLNYTTASNNTRNIAVNIQVKGFAYRTK